MKRHFNILFVLVGLFVFGCDDDENEGFDEPSDSEYYFQYTVNDHSYLYEYDEDESEDKFLQVAFRDPDNWEAAIDFESAEIPLAGEFGVINGESSIYLILIGENDYYESSEIEAESDISNTELNIKLYSTSDPIKGQFWGTAKLTDWSDDSERNVEIEGSFSLKPQTDPEA